MDYVKNPERSNNLRLEGNQYFKKKYYFDALLCYNESLCYADPNSSEISLIYGNRSAVYYMTKYYEFCLDNIQLARDNGFEDYERMRQREEKCWKEMPFHVQRPDDDPWDFYSLDRVHNRHYNLPNVISALTLRHNTKFGRYIITNKELKSGEFIAIDEPFFKIRHFKARYRRCITCMKFNGLNLIPCPGCTSTMFCSHMCMELGTDSFHQYECSVLEMIHNEFDDYILQAAVRIFLESITACGSKEDLFVIMNERRERSPFDFQLREPLTQQNKRHLLLCTQNMTKFESTDELKEAFSNQVRAYFDRNHLLARYWGDVETQAYVIFYCRTQYQILINNQFHMMWRSVGRRDIDAERAGKAYNNFCGYGLSPFMSLFNHSCNPNVAIVSVDNKFVAYVKRPIKAHTQLFISYNLHFTQLCRSMRRIEMKERYNFNCLCKACVERWPSGPVDIKRDPKFHAYCNHITRFFGKDLQKYRYYNLYIDRNAANSYPSNEISICMCHIQEILGSFAKSSSFFPFC